MTKNDWEEEEIDAYEIAVMNESEKMDSRKDYDIFKASTHLAYIFELTKEETIEDLIKVRS